MFGKHHTLARLSSGIAVAVSLAVFAVPSAVATTSAPFITDTLGGNGSARALPDVVDRYIARQAAAQSNHRPSTHVVRDAGARAYNAHAYVNGGASPTVARAIQDLGSGLAPTQSGTIVAGSSGFSWDAAVIGAGLVAGVVLLLLAATRLRTSRRGSLTA